MGSDDVQDVFEDNFSILVGVLGAMAATLRDGQQRAGGLTLTPGQEMPAPRSSAPLGLVEKMFLHRQAGGFGAARIEVLADLARDSDELHFTAGQRLWSRGDASDHWHLILSGTLSCSDANGKQWRAGGGGAVLGALDALSDQPRWYDMVAEGDVRTLRTSRICLLDTLEDHSDMGMELLRTLAMAINQIFAKLSASG